MYIVIRISLKITDVDHRTRFNRPTGAQSRLQFIQWLCITKIEEKKRTIISVLSSESHHDATFIFTQIGKLVPLLKEIVPNLEMIHYWTDSPTSKYRNKTIFKVIRYYEEYSNCKASWNYMEADHRIGPCDPIGGNAKRKVD